MPVGRGDCLKAPACTEIWADMVDKQLILDSVGPVQAVLDAHDGVVNVIDTTGEDFYLEAVPDVCYSDDSNANLLLPDEIGRSQ